MPTTLNPTATLSPAALAALRSVPILQSLADNQLHLLDGTTEIHLAAGELLFSQGDATHQFWILLDGSLNIFYNNPEGAEQSFYVMHSGASFGEVTLLASIPAPYNLRAVATSHLLELNEDQFWTLMNQCPGVRKAVLGNMAARLAKMQQATFQQEKMAALGTLAAGLMHELNNPGAAARRAAAQLRENFMRMHRLTYKWARTQLTENQKQCMYDIQEIALSARNAHTMSSIEQSDAEEALAEWMEGAEIEDAWRVAPTLVSVGIDAATLDCARHSFPPDIFSDSINWLEAIVSSMQLVGTIEESIGRVTELVAAVKSYAYEGRGQKQSIDINRSILATLIIVGHKIREKQISIAKDLSRDLPPLNSDCQGINQIWTNLLDNAIDAAPQNGQITVKTWPEQHGDQTHLCILVQDNGSGIPLDAQPHIFDPFYTTKPVGVGTGLGLGIVQRIVEQFGGSIHFTSAPGETEFVVRIPNHPA